MSILSKIHFGTKPAHKALETKPFLMRYKTTELSLLDHYQHLTQLLPLYEMLETRMKAAHFEPRVPSEFEYLLNRSGLIKQDLKALAPFIKASQKDQVLSSTKKYIKTLEDLISQPKGDEQIFYHYLVRILGDLFGGQKVKNYVTELYARNNIPSNYPVSFYEFPAKTLQNFTSWLNTLPMDDDNIIPFANNAFIQNGYLFDALETARPSELKQEVTVALPLQNYGLFNRKNVVVGMAVAVGCAAASYLVL